MMSLLQAIVLLVFIVNVYGLPTPEDFLITYLPLYDGTFSDIPFKQYSGYMPIGDIDDTYLFFWFFESQNSPSNDPIILWTNGGPGASSVEDGMWMEHGPFKLQKYGFGVNSYFDYAWNKIANVIYLETPSGVGFSYSNKQTGYDCSDNKSAEINYLFLKQFRSVFTSFNNNTFYLTGESFSGHYTTELAQKIIQENKSKEWNLGGIFLGNPRIDNDGFTGPNYYSYLTYLWSHGIIPQTAYLKSFTACNWTNFLTDCNNSAYYQHPNQQCIDANNEAFKYIPNGTGYDLYDIYAPTCHQQPRLDNNDDNYDPCMEQYIPEYMNREDVLTAIHAIDHYNKIWPDKPYGWNYGSQLEDVSLIYPYFFGNDPNWKITIFDGDADTAEPFIEQNKWINCLKRPLVKDWFNWYYNLDVAGSIKIFKGITYQTIKHCGHLLPTYCPQKAFQIFYDYINGTYSA